MTSSRNSSRALSARLFRLSAIGLVIAAVAWYGGELLRANVPVQDSSLAIGSRLAAAGIGALGMVGTLLFGLLALSSGLHLMFNKRG